MNANEIDTYLKGLQQELLNETNFKSIQLTRSWATNAPSRAGVYVFKDANNIVYVGETGNLKGRMCDLLNTMNHCIRRSIGAKHFSNVSGYKKATSECKFPEHIECLVDEYISRNLKVSFLPVALGRKELEEMLVANIHSDFRLNKRSKRKES